MFRRLSVDIKLPSFPVSNSAVVGASKVFHRIQYYRDVVETVFFGCCEWR